MARRVATLAVAYTAGYAALLLLLPADLPNRAFLADMAYLPAHALAAWALWLVARAEPQRGPRWTGFMSLAFSQAVGTTNALGWVLSSAGAIPLDSPFFQYNGILVTSASVFGIAKLVPLRKAVGGAAALPWLDIALFGLAAMSVGWYFVGSPLMLSGAETVSGFAWFVAITSADAFTALLALAAWTYPTTRLHRRAAALLAVSFAGASWADIYIELSIDAGTYVSGEPVDAIFSLILLLLVFVAVVETDPALDRTDAGPEQLLTARALAPLVATAAVFLPVALGVATEAGRRVLAVPVALAGTFVVVLQWRHVLLDREVERTLTARLGLERDLSLARQFESLGRFSAAIAHDFNNLLSALLANVQFLALDGRLNVQERETLRAMEGTIGRGTTLSRRLLSLMGGKDLPPVATDLGKLSRAVVISLADLMPARVRLETVLPSAPVLVALRPGDGDQLLLNLLINARDAMAQGGRITIRCWEGEGEAVLEVEDEGMGIPAAIRQRIFEPLFTTKKAQHGTGLGLLTVQSVVQEANGTVTVWSAEGKGTRFTVRLPLFEA